MSIGPRPIHRSVRLGVPDRPGALAEVTSVLADHNVDIVRLEVWPADRTKRDTRPTAHDDISLAAAEPAHIDGAIRELRSLGFETLTLPESWWLRDWAVEVFNAIELLDAASEPALQVDAVVEIASRLANTTHAAVIADPPGRPRSEHRLTEMVAVFDLGWIRWTGQDRVLARFRAAFADAADGPVRSLRPIDAIHGLAVEIPGPTAASAVLGVAGVRPPFLSAEVTRLEHFASLVGRLHPIEPALSGL